MSLSVRCFFHKDTNTSVFVAWDPETKACALIDTVLDFDITNGRISTKSADELIAFIEEKGLKVEHILETHVHADHVTAADYLRKKLNAPVGTGACVTTVQEAFVKLYNLGDDVKTDGSQFDNLWKDGDEFRIGSVPVKVFHTPGHTPACVCYLAGDALFAGDTIFMPDFGTARCDFPGGSASVLYEYDYFVRFHFTHF